MKREPWNPEAFVSRVFEPTGPCSPEVRDEALAFVRDEDLNAQLPGTTSAVALGVLAWAEREGIEGLRGAEREVTVAGAGLEATRAVRLGTEAVCVAACGYYRVLANVYSDVYAQLGTGPQLLHAARVCAGVAAGLAWVETSSFPAVVQSALRIEGMEPEVRELPASDLRGVGPLWGVLGSSLATLTAMEALLRSGLRAQAGLRVKPSTIRTQSLVVMREALGVLVGCRRVLHEGEYLVRHVDGEPTEHDFRSAQGAEADTCRESFDAWVVELLGKLCERA